MATVSISEDHLASVIHAMPASVEKKFLQHYLDKGNIQPVVEFIENADVACRKGDRFYPERLTKNDFNTEEMALLNSLVPLPQLDISRRRFLGNLATMATSGYLLVDGAQHLARDAADLQTHLTNKKAEIPPRDRLRGAVETVLGAGLAIELARVDRLDQLEDRLALIAKAVEHVAVQLRQQGQSASYSCR